MKEQIQATLTKKLKAGEGTSKKKAQLDGTEVDKIFSYNTFKSYKRVCYQYAEWLSVEHPDVTTLEKSRKYMGEWLDFRVNEPDLKGRYLSAWTIQLMAKALGKLYGITPLDPDYYHCPQRRSVDIIRSRGDKEMDRHFSERNNDELVKFCKGTGCRRNILEKLEGRDLFSRKKMIEKVAALKEKEELSEAEKINLYNLEEALSTFEFEQYFIHCRNDKGGKSHYSPIIGNNMMKIVERMENTKPNEKVWWHVPKNMDVHHYRSLYSVALYKKYARPIDLIPYDRVKPGLNIPYQSEVYICKRSESGKRLDRASLQKVSKALGHNRIDTAVTNYIRGI